MGRSRIGIIAVVLTALLAPAAPTAAADPPPAVDPPPVAPDPVPVSGVPAGPLAFHDEFDGAALDTAAWGTCNAWGACLNAGNTGDFANAQCYAPDNVSVAGGLLSLTARSEPATCDGATKAYTSGMVQARGAARRYGYFEARIRVPSGDDDSVGFWPAFWLLPADLSWPPEIDVFEFFGGASTGDAGAMLTGADGFLHPQRFSTTLHRADGSQIAERHYGDGGPGSTAWDADFHVWGLDWRAGRLRVYVDQTLVLDTDAGVPDVPMYPIVNLALREKYATWLPGELPQAMDVDYVRIWE